MTRRRWIADEASGNTAALTGEHAAHLARVLRTEVGQEFDISTGDSIRRGTVTAVSEHRVEFSLGDAVSRESERAHLDLDITIALSIFKFDRMEWAIEKCTEIGVARIVPVVARRSDAHLAAAAPKRRERWQRIARQASEQSRRGFAPEITAPLELRDFLSGNNQKQEVGALIVLSESEKDARLAHLLQERAGKVFLAVGPEGGWTHEELAMFRAAGWTPATLGATILRAETAAIVASALAMDAFR